MPRIPITDLSKYLLQGQLCQRGCLRFPRTRRLPLSTLSARLPSSFKHSQTGRLHTAIQPTQEDVAPAAPPSPATKNVPLRKQLKDQAKSLKTSGKKKKPNVQNQTVPGWELTVGIEIHAQLNTHRKLFSPATSPLPTDDPNTRVALFDLAMPGSQPLFQTENLIPALRAALALNCDIQKTSRWDRKHYFHWDQPSGYQITQYYEPFAREGHITVHARDGIAAEDGDSITIGIQQIQMEQDTAKTLAQPGDVHWLDFNRVGVPLIEIITKPEIHHPATAAALVRKVQMYLTAVDSCVSGMESGGLRADVNVSVRRTGDASLPLGQRTEIKNLSSFKAVEDAIIAERDRQIAVLEEGGVVLGETRGWSLGSTETRRLRGKEGEVDYRYLPDPDLGPVTIGEDVVSHLRENLGVLPDAEVDHLVNTYGLTPKDALALMLLDDGGRIEYFYNILDRLHARIEAGTGTAESGECAILASNWVLHELGKLTAERNASADGSTTELGMTSTGECARVPAAHLADIIFFLHTRRITSRVAKELLFAVFRGDLAGESALGTSVEEVIEKQNLWFHGLSEAEYESLAAEALQGEESVLKQFVGYKRYPDGKLMFLVGRMMKLGQAERIDPQLARDVMKRVIEDRVNSL